MAGFWLPADERTAPWSCVLGASLARQLFGYRDPVGEQLRVLQNYYTVVGVLRERGVDPKASGAFSWRNVNDVAIVPLPALSQRTLAVEPNQATDEIWLQVTDGERVTQLARDLSTHTLERLHGVHFEVVVPRELLAQRYRTQQTFSIVVGSVAALALTVGGIGIMNIMLTSVVERTHEIGIRRAMGASQRDITSQFLIEALLMTATGGTLGIIIGIAVSFGITEYAGWSTYISAWAVALAFAVSCFVGLIFRSYPAIKAATLAPVDALRYE